MSRARYAVLAAFVVTSATPALAADGVLIAQKTTSGTSVTTTQVQIERTRMRTEVVTGGETQVIVFNGTAQVMYIITPAKKSYVEITKAQVDQMGGMVQGMMAQMQAQMANLPPEQRAQMEGMMRGRGMGMGGGATERTTYKRSGTDRVAKWTCDKYEGHRSGKKVTDLCTVAPTALGLAPADFAITQQLAEFISAIMPQAGEQVSAMGRGGADGYAGVPVRTITGGTTFEVTDISRQTFADALFVVPQGFQKQSMFGAR